jgi:hypothetical protein
MLMDKSFSEVLNFTAADSTTTENTALIGSTTTIGKKKNPFYLQCV